MQVDPAATEIGHLMQRMVAGFHSHAAAILAAQDPRLKTLFTKVEPGQVVPLGYVRRKNGNPSRYHLHHFLDQARTDPQVIADLERTWLTGTLLTVGDALAKADYFDHEPELELIYHLRNGIAHGNKFNITMTGRNRLNIYPAHNRRIPQIDASDFEITPALNGDLVLFHFMDPQDIIDVLLGASVFLLHKGNGLPLPPSYQAKL